VHFAGPRIVETGKWREQFNLSPKLGAWGWHFQVHAGIRQEQAVNGTAHVSFGERQTGGQHSARARPSRPDPSCRDLVFDLGTDPAHHGAAVVELNWIAMRRCEAVVHGSDEGIPPMRVLSGYRAGFEHVKVAELERAPDVECSTARCFKQSRTAASDASSAPSNPAESSSRFRTVRWRRPWCDR
jgi:hypothetical protein